MAARELMAPALRCHQVVAEAPRIIERTPDQYTAHVADMLAAFGRFRFTVTALLAEDDHVYVRWRQDGHHLADVDGHPPTGAPLTEVGSAVYRVEDGRIAEYWVQLDRLGFARQLQDGTPTG